MSRGENVMMDVPESVISCSINCGFFVSILCGIKEAMWQTQWQSPWDAEDMPVEKSKFIN